MLFLLAKFKLYLCTMRRLLVLCFLLSLTKGYAQETVLNSYKEDQFYVDINFPLQFNSFENFKQNGFSRSIHFGALKDITLNKKGTHAIAVGLGYGFLRLVNNLNIRREQGQYLYSFPTNGIDLRNAFSTHQFQLPIELRWRSSTPTDYAFWRIHLGYRLSYQFSERYKPFFGSSFSLDNQLTPWQHSVSLVVGYNTWNIRFSYGLSPFLQDKIRTDQGVEPLIYPVQLGLIFYLL